MAFYDPTGLDFRSLTPSHNVSLCLTIHLPRPIDPLTYTGVVQARVLVNRFGYLAASLHSAVLAVTDGAQPLASVHV